VSSREAKSGHNMLCPYKREETARRKRRREEKGGDEFATAFTLKKARKCDIMSKGSLLDIQIIRRCGARLRIGGLDEGRRAICDDG
jgi:hypothetical protein